MQKQPTIKIVPIKLNTEFTPEEGWILKDLISSPVDSKDEGMVFHAVIMKLPPQVPPGTEPADVKKDSPILQQ